MSIALLVICATWPQDLIVKLVIGRSAEGLEVSRSLSSSNMIELGESRWEASQDAAVGTESCQRKLYRNSGKNITTSVHCRV